MMRIACRRSQLFFSLSSNSVTKSSQIGAVKYVRPSSPGAPGTSPSAPWPTRSWPTRSSSCTPEPPRPDSSAACCERRWMIVSIIDDGPAVNISSMPEVTER